MDIITVERKLRLLETLNRQIEGIELELVSDQYTADTAEALATRLALAGHKQAQEMRSNAAKLRADVDTTRWRRDKAYDLLEVYTGITSAEVFRDTYRKMTHLYNLWQDAQLASMRAEVVDALADEREPAAQVLAAVGPKLEELAETVNLPELFNFQQED
jgi:hypothetical protein